MSDLSPNAAPSRCPSCNLSVSANDQTCPNCGQPLRQSDLEIIAAQYKNNIIKRTKRRSWWISISLIIFTLFLALGLTGMSMNVNVQSTSSFVITTMLLIFFVGLSIFSFFKPLTTAVIALSIFSIIGTLATIGFMSTPGEMDSVVKYILLSLLLFPICQIIGIITLKKQNNVI